MKNLVLHAKDHEPNSRFAEKLFPLGKFSTFLPPGDRRIKWKSSGYPKSGPFWCAVLRGVRTERAAVPRAPSGRQGPKTWALRFGARRAAVPRAPSGRQGPKTWALRFGARRAAVPRAPSGRQGLRHGLLFEFLACPAPGESLVSNPCTHAERGRGIAGCEMDRPRGALVSL